MVCKRVLFTDVSNQEDLFNTVSDYLNDLDYVKDEYKEKIIEREAEFPTGLKIDFLEGKEGLNVAIPHSETKYCNVKTVFYVRNKNYIKFKNIINPSEELDVCMFFFILNNESESQSNVLATLMDFFTKDDNLSLLKSMDNEDEIEKYLLSKGV